MLKSVFCAQSLVTKEFPDLFPESDYMRHNLLSDDLFSIDRSSVQIDIFKNVPIYVSQRHPRIEITLYSVFYYERKT